VRHRTVLKEVQLALAAHAAREGLSRDALEDRHVPTHGLDEHGRSAALTLEANGKVTARAKARGAKALARTISIERARLEEAMVEERAWKAEDWRALLRHPVLGNLARRLVVAREPGGLALGGDVPEGCERVSIAHPATLPADERLRWREELVAKGIVQPFRQLWREVYAPSSAETRALRSERFAGQVVPWAQLYALTKGRGWSGFGNVELGAEGKRAFATRGVDALACVRSLRDPGLVRLEGVLFERREKKERVPLAMGEVPPVVFSEAFRDLDLVVGVGTPAAARAELVERLLPSLGLGERARVEGRWVVVRGDLHDYRVHLGSGNVQVADERRALALPPLAPRPLYLPVEDELDPVTTEILEKTLLLARDVLVEDEAVARELAGDDA
jgi:hypothetical protein